MKNPTTPVYIGSKKVQVGKLAGVEIPGFILIRDVIYKRLNFSKSSFPVTVAGTVYTLDGKEVIATGSRTIGGQKVEVKRTIGVQQCTKPVTIYFKGTRTFTVTRQGKKFTQVRRNRARVGFPSWAGVKEIRKFLKDAGSVHSFSISGGTHLVNSSNGK
jgi:hypothetical protein